ncbi:hypothetical protein MPSEU_000342700 [Mayamaea pseudoterrestris]|nr:hypothetical protein MPSEU_000342700 [Mayamaea pseudoterrestris]
MMKLLLPFVCLIQLALAATNTTFSDNVVYNKWLAGSDYRNSLFIPADNNVNGAAVHWTISDDNTTLNLAVAVEASGWVGFGLSENGGMTGSDMMIYEAAKPNIVLDAYVTQDRYPQIDDCQDWTFVDATVEDNTMIVEVSRKLFTGDTQDLAILDDTSSGFPVHRIISAWGDSESFSYHGMDRARGTIRWFGGSVTEVERFEAIMEPYKSNKIVVMADNYPIKPIDTEYAHICVSGDDLRDQGVDLDTGVTMIGIEPYVTNSHVHHFTAYASLTENNGDTGCNGTDYISMVYLWAPGEPPNAFPDFLGMPIGGNSGFRSFRIEFHYDNPQLEEGILDSSGITYYYSTEPREQTMGIMQIGDPIVALDGTLIPDGTTSYSFNCPASCTKSVLDEPVTVIREYLHLHKSGASSYSQHFRDGNMIRSSKAEYYDFAQQGAQAILQEPYEVLPGDAFKVGCYYENEPGTNRTFGLGSSNEMCISFLYYYPAKATPSGLPFFCGVGLTDMLPDCDIPSEGISVSDDSSQELLAERAFGAATEQCAADEMSGILIQTASLGLILSVLAFLVVL